MTFFRTCAFIVTVSFILLCNSALSQSREEERSVSSPKKQKPGPKVSSPSQGKKDDILGEKIPDYIARWELARTLYILKRYDESIEEYQTLLKNRPDLAEARVELISVMAWTDDEDKHTRAASMAKKMDVEQLSEDKRIELANAMASLELYSKAIKIYKSYLDKHPGDLKVRLRYAAALSWAKQYPESLKQYEMVLEKRPDDIQVRRKYAMVLIWAGKHEKAAEELKTTLD